MRKIPAIALVILSFYAGELFAQSECTQKLRTARATYEQGRLHELPNLLEGCLASGFSESEKVEAYKLLIQTYIYLEEPDSADLHMINLLNEDHFFQVNEAIDPVEFKSLYKKFRSDPVYRFGARVGMNFSHINVLKNYFIWANSQGKGDYKTNAGIQFGLLLEKDLPYLQNKLTFNPELFYSSYSFVYSNPDPLSTDQNKVGKLEHTLSQSRAQANFLFQYRIEKELSLADQFTPYVAFGPSVAYTLTSGFDGVTSVGTEITGSELDTRVNYKPMIISLLASAGLKLKLGEIYLTADVRYQYGLMNVVNAGNRLTWNAETDELKRFGYIDNDFTLSQTMFNIGIIIPHFHPIKLIR